MKRYSKRNQLVTLSDLNVTPMLDLAFVLLIIFVIATPLLEQGMKLELPDGGAADSAVKRDDVLQLRSVAMANIFWTANRCHWRNSRRRSRRLMRTTPKRWSISGPISMG